ncbi:MAG: tRNA (5-methylaminomethyl-2-thiouridine)(34)-methyltransferase MnmD [Sediminibacterium sp.]
MEPYQENSLNNTAVNKSRRRELKQTADGSFTLFIPEVEETYHSTHGAVQESMHVFIENGLKACDKEVIRILEVGLGTGLNAALTLQHTTKKIDYCALEPYPLSKEILNELSTSGSDQFEMKFHLSVPNEWISIHEQFSFARMEVGLEEFSSEEKFDVIYYDAFGPRVEPGLWTLERMQQCFNLLNEGGIFVTYCAKGEVRRNLQAAGFVVERLAGPPGKREMLRGLKKR